MKVDHAPSKPTVDQPQAHPGALFGHTVKVLTGGIPFLNDGNTSSSPSAIIGKALQDSDPTVRYVSADKIKARNHGIMGQLALAAGKDLVALETIDRFCYVSEKTDALIKKNNLKRDHPEFQALNQAIVQLKKTLEQPADAIQIKEDLASVEAALIALRNNVKSAKNIDKFRVSETVVDTNTKPTIIQKKGCTYIAKPTPKDDVGFDEDPDDNRNANRREASLGDAWNLILPQGSPKINIVVGGPDDSFYVTSKFFKDFQPLRSIMEKGLLDKVSGIEDILAACMLMGDKDFHMENIGVIPDPNKEGHFIAVKIDHGKSGLMFYDTPEKLLEGFTSIVKAQGYGGVKEGDFKIDQKKLKASLERMMVAAETEKMATAIKVSTAKVLDAGFQLSAKDLLAEELTTSWDNISVTTSENRMAMKAIRKAIESGDLKALDAIKTAHSKASPDVLAFVNTLITHRNAFNKCKTNEQKVQFVGDFYKEKLDKNITVIKGFVSLLETQDLV